MVVAEKLAERGGFEPPVRFYSYNGLANRRFRPLSHLSTGPGTHKMRGLQVNATNRAPWSMVLIFGKHPDSSKFFQDRFFSYGKHALHLPAGPELGMNERVGFRAVFGAHVVSVPFDGLSSPQRQHSH